MARWMLLLVVAIAVGAMVSGCGGGSGGRSTTNGGSPATKSSGSEGSGGEQAAHVQTSSLSKRQFVKQASAACGKLKANLLPKISAYMRAHGGEGEARPVMLAGAFKSVLIPIVEAETAVVRNLGAPAGDEAEVEALLEAQEEAVTAAKRVKALDPNEGAKKYFAQANAKFKAYGLSECSYSL